MFSPLRTLRAPLLGARPLVARPSVVRRLLHWPARPDPSPYEIFGLNPQQPAFDKKKLHEIYCQLVKTYHPDMGSTGDADRFKKVVEAHNILKDDAKRRSYDFMANHAPPHASESYRATYRASRPGERFEDDWDVNYWSNQSSQRFDQGLYESRIWVLKLIVGLGTFFAVVNFFFIDRAAKARVAAANAETERVAAHLAAAQGLDGLDIGDNSAGARIARFLRHRQHLLDEYNHEFTYDSLLRGSTRRNRVLGGRPPTPDVPAEMYDQVKSTRGGGTSELANELADEITGEITSEIASEVLAARMEAPRPRVAPTKRNVGPVAEYFGRT